MVALLYKSMLWNIKIKALVWLNSETSQIWLVKTPWENGALDNANQSEPVRFPLGLNSWKKLSNHISNNCIFLQEHGAENDTQGFGEIESRNQSEFRDENERGKLEPIRNWMQVKRANQGALFEWKPIQNQEGHHHPYKILQGNNLATNQSNRCQIGVKSLRFHFPSIQLRNIQLDSPSIWNIIQINYQLHLRVGWIGWVGWMDPSRETCLWLWDRCAFFAIFFYSSPWDPARIPPRCSVVLQEIARCTSKQPAVILSGLFQDPWRIGSCLETLATPFRID